MNWELFAAFMVVAAILFITPGPVVTLVIATGASHGIAVRGLATVAGSSVGLALLLTAIALGLTWVLQPAATIFEMLRYVGAAYLVWGRHRSVAQRRKACFRCAERPREFPARPRGWRSPIPRRSCFLRPFYRNSSSPDCPGAAARDHLRDVGRAGGDVRFRLGRRRRTEPRVALEASARDAAWPGIGRGAGRRRRLAVVGAATGRA